MIELFHGDCRELLAIMPSGSVDACVTDPPYHLTTGKRGGSGPASASASTPQGRARIGTGFMGKAWDGGDVAFTAELWAEVFRVLKPGAHLLAFGGTRTSHRMACAIEDAGFEIRDSLMWLYGSGMPKSRDMAKAIDKEAGRKGRVVPIGNARARMIPGQQQHDTGSWAKDSGREYQPGEYQPATSAAAHWQGWGTGLKPAYEPIVVARKPLERRTVAANVQAHGTGALNIDGCRIGTTDALGGGDQSGRVKVKPEGWDRPWMRDEAAKAAHAARVNANVEKAEALGRWPANVIHDGSPEVEEAFARFGERNSARANGNPNNPHRGLNHNATSYGQGDGAVTNDYRDTGTAARFFYSAKATAADRAGSKHPTVKPIALMRYLVRLVTPAGGLVLDPFAGSGTTGAACQLEGMRALLMEADAGYAADIRRRFAKAAA